MYFGGAAGQVSSSQSGLTWGLSPDNREVDLYFPSDPVASDTGNLVWFKVYTDNTAQENSLFSITTYPTDTAVAPEPASLLALASSFLGLGFWFRKRS